MVPRERQRIIIFTHFTHHQSGIKGKSKHRGSFQRHPSQFNLRGDRTRMLLQVDIVSIDHHLWCIYITIVHLSVELALRGCLHETRDVVVGSSYPYCPEEDRPREPTITRLFGVGQAPE